MVGSTDFTSQYHGHQHHQVSPQSSAASTTNQSSSSSSPPIQFTGNQFHESHHQAAKSEPTAANSLVGGIPSQMQYQNSNNWYGNPSDGRFASKNPFFIDNTTTKRKQLTVLTHVHPLDISRGSSKAHYIILYVNAYRLVYFFNYLKMTSSRAHLKCQVSLERTNIIISIYFFR